MVGDGQAKRAPAAKTWWLVAVFVTVGSALGVAVWREFKRSYVVEHHAVEVRSDRVKLEADREALRILLASLKNPETLEREAKVRLNLRREGESVVVLVPGEGGEGNAERPRPQIGEFLPKPSVPPPPNFVANALSWWDYFFGVR